MTWASALRMVRTRTEVACQSSAGSLTKIQGCAEDQCEGGDPVACEFGDWRDWSACDQCDGERKRKRNIKQYAQNGGSNCDAFAGEEVDKCPRSCVPGFCTWSTWGSWGSCHGCGRSARRERTRELRATENAAMRQPPLSETRVERLTLHHSEVTAAQDGYTALVAEVGALRTAPRPQTYAGIRAWPRDGTFGFRFPSTAATSSCQNNWILVVAAIRSRMSQCGHNRAL